MAQLLNAREALRRERVEARIRGLTDKRFIAEALLMGDTANVLATRYMQETEKYLDDLVAEIPELAEFPRAQFGEVEKEAIARKYGLEVLVSFESVRFNRISDVERAQRKLRDSIIRFVDTKTLAVITGDANVNQHKAKAAWGADGSDPLADLIDAVYMAREHGYEPDTLVVPLREQAALLKDKAIRDAIDNTSMKEPLVRDRYLGRLMGLDIVWTDNMAPGKAIVLQRKIAGTLHDALGLTVDVYRVPAGAETGDYVIRALRICVPYLTDPKAVTVITNTTA